MVVFNRFFADFAGIFLDESTESLDVENTQAIMRMLINQKACADKIFILDN